jgi:hypothetical protein
MTYFFGVKLNRLKMKKTSLIIALCAAMLGSCTDKCTETRITRRTSSVQLGYNVVRNGIGVETQRDMINVGKIYSKDNYIYINELKEGVHLIDNTNPASPREVSFLRIPGNTDIAIRDNILYADSYMDVVALSITSPTTIKEVGRVKDVFNYGTADGLSWSADSARKIIYDTQGQWIKQTLMTSCDDNYSVNPAWGWRGLEDASFSSKASPQAGGATGTGGSLARMTIANDVLYSVTNNGLQVFSLKKDPNLPQKGKFLNLNWGIETIFPYKDRLFIGSNQGMYIFDNSNPESPVQMSSFTHARACDPVVADDKYAYVTLRNNNSWCTGISNQLEVVDISTITNPRMVRIYPMASPYGLAKDGDKLYICEGKNGFKSLNATNVQDIKQIQHLKDVIAYDVIALNKSLLTIGRDGLYQYDASDPAKLKLLSILPVKKPFTE